MTDFSINNILHVSLIVADTHKSLVFYHDMLGFDVDAGRPDLGYPGAWLIVGEQQIHLLELSNPDPVENRPEHGGRDRHVALSVSNIAALKKTLTLQKIRFTESKSGRAAIFFRDPDGNAIEIVESVSPP